MPIIILNEERMHTLSVDRETNLRLVPGSNTVDQDLIDKLMDKKKGSDSFCAMCDDGIIEILDEDAVDTDDDGNEIIDVTNLSVKKITELMESESDIEVLQSYLAQENGKSGGPRPSVIKLITKHIGSLEEANAGDNGNDED